MSVEHIPKLFSLTLLDTLSAVSAEKKKINARVNYFYRLHNKWQPFVPLLYFSLVRRHEVLSPQFSCVSHRQEVSFAAAAAAGCLVSHDQCESQDPVPSVIPSEPVTFMFPLTSTALQKLQMLSVSFITLVSSEQDQQ